MRFLTLDLRNYGPFQNAPVLDLSGGERGLHLILGPNEAGKSSALRAIRALLFDYPRSTPDDHGRDATTLRVGARLRGATGQEVEFLRRKRGNRFWTLDDRSSIAGDPLESVLGDLDESTFESLFSTDHAELVAGGRAILQGGGKLGAMLFAAGSGLAQLEQVQTTLQGELDKLFKASSNARIPAINKGFADLKVLRESVKKDALPTADWVAVDGQLGRAVTRRAEVVRRKHEAQIDLDGWKRRLGAMRVIPRRQEVIDRLDARPSRGVLRSDFAEVFRAESERARSAERAIREIRDARDAATARLDALGAPDPTLAEAEVIERLQSALGQYAQARRERPEVAARLDRAEELSRSIRGELPERAVVPPAGLGSLRDPIQRMAREQAVLQATKSEAEAELARLEPSVAGSSDSPTVGPDLSDQSSSLEGAIGRIVALGDLEAQRLDAQGKLDQADTKAATKLRGLSLWSGTLDELEALVIPPSATFDRFDAEIRRIEDQIKGAEAERIALETQRIDLDRKAERAALGGSAPSVADLARERARRDDLWRSIRRAWVDREPLASTPGRLADDFESRTHQADDLADRLRTEADRVAAQAQREIQRRDLDDRRQLWLDTLARAQADHAAKLADWADLWRPLGVEPWPPGQMKDWVRVDRQERLRAAQTVRDARAEVARLSARIDQARLELNQALDPLGEPEVAPRESLAAALARSRAIVARIKARVDRESARVRLAEVVALEAAWLDRWRVAVDPIGLPREASVATATGVIDRLGEWADATKTARACRVSLDDLDAILARFATEARSLADRLGLSTLALDAEEVDWQPVIKSLVDQLKKARKAKTQRDQCHDRLDEEAVKLAREQSALARAHDTLAALAAEAACATVDALPDAIRRSDEVAADLADLERFDEQLDGFAGSLSRAGLLEAVAGLDDAAVSNRIAEGGDALATLDADLAAIGEEIGGCRARLAAMDDRKGAAEAQQEVEDHAARLGSHVEQYARLKLASAVLREAIERYRVKNQGPVLQRAGDLFARLTAGSFSGLQTDVDDKGEPILRGVRSAPPRAEGSAVEAESSAPIPPVDVAAMSEGTADQLYLALRLACLSVHLDDHAPAPLVVDDILINFDDLRAQAALEALAELAKRTQVLFFTHHDHLAEIARGCLPAEALFVHRLVPRSAPIAGSDPAAPANSVGSQGRRRRSSTASPAEV